MTWLHLIILAIVQGLTEFLPVSSSAHLILPARIFGWPDQGPLIDLMAHAGSLLAVLVYFRKDVADIIAGFFELFARKLSTRSALALNLIIATPPALIFGAVLSVSGLDEAIRSPLIIAIMTIIFGIALWLSDVWAKSERGIETLTWKGAFLIGLAQMVALIPGTSRSGITMTAARGLGLSREEAARFSMLMSLPVIGAGGAYAALKLATSEPELGVFQATLTDGLLVAGLSAVAAYACIAVFMRVVSKIGFLPFMIYRLALGAALLGWIALS